MPQHLDPNGHLTQSFEVVAMVYGMHASGYLRIDAENCVFALVGQFTKVAAHPPGPIAPGLYKCVQARLVPRDDRSGKVVAVYERQESIFHIRKTIRKMNG